MGLQTAAIVHDRDFVRGRFDRGAPIAVSSFVASGRKTIKRSPLFLPVSPPVIAFRRVAAKLLIILANRPFAGEAPGVLFDRKLPVFRKKQTAWAVLKGLARTMLAPKPLTSAQIRAARALIRWSAQELANVSSVGVTTIRRAELTQSETKLTRANDQAIRRTLEAAGVEFIDAEGGGPGVRLRSG